MGDDVTIIDTHMHGHAGITGAFLLRGEQVALVETGPKSSASTVLASLDGMGVESLDWIIVTHIHLDHAGAAGTLAARFPQAAIAVHEVGAPHLVDPSKLWSSARRIYGDHMDELWGGVDPVPPARIRVLHDGDVVDLGGRALRAVETLGHAGHHHAYLDDATGALFAGDALGVRLGNVGIVRPATPPPEFDLEVALASIGRIRALEPTDLYLTHFGPLGDGRGPPVEELCLEAAGALTKWASWVRGARADALDLDQVTQTVRRRARDDVEGRISDEDIERLENTTSYWMNTAGYMRYFDKLDEAKGPASR
jgi:glyoxylase-like metal-dependent hydrolase (beta-lactamase superfamily II)